MKLQENKSTTFSIHVECKRIYYHFIILPKHYAVEINRSKNAMYGFKLHNCQS